MTVIRNEIIGETTVRFPADSGYWVAAVEVRRKMYANGEQYYYIGYVWYAAFDDVVLAYKTWDEVVEMEDNCDSDTIQKKNATLMKNAHPFYSNGSNLDRGYNGKIIAQNEISDSLVKYIVMDETELVKYSGGMTASNYREVIMHHVNDQGVITRKLVFAPPSFHST